MPTQESPVPFRIFYSNALQCHAVYAKELHNFIYPTFLDESLLRSLSGTINGCLSQEEKDENTRLMQHTQQAKKKAPSSNDNELYFGKEAAFVLWLQRHIEQYCFEEGLDFQRDKGEATFTLSAAKELARITRTEQGRKARYQILDFEQERDKQRIALSAMESGTLNEEVEQVATCDLIHLIQAIRQYQHIMQFCVVQDSDYNPAWANEVIERVKLTTGKRLGDEVS